MIEVSLPVMLMLLPAMGVALGVLGYRIGKKADDEATVFLDRSSVDSLALAPTDRAASTENEENP